MTETYSLSRSCLGFDSQSKAAAGDFSLDSASSVHPGHNASSAEIVTHVVGVHHRALRDQLMWIQSLLDCIAPQSPNQTCCRRQIDRLFAKLQCDLCDCLDAERCQIFPQFQLAEPGAHSARPLIGEAIRAMERTHARTLLTVWKLLDLARDAAAENPNDEALVIELSAFSHEYHQHLYEVECLLLPRFISARPPGASHKSVPSSVRVTK